MTSSPSPPRRLLLTCAFLVALHASLVPPTAAKRDANSRFKLCCAKQTTADQACKRRWCDFNVLSQDNVS